MMATVSAVDGLLEPPDSDQETEQAKSEAPVKSKDIFPKGTSSCDAAMRQGAGWGRRSFSSQDGGRGETSVLRLLLVNIRNRNL